MARSSKSRAVGLMASVGSTLLTIVIAQLFHIGQTYAYLYIMLAAVLGVVIYFAWIILPILFMKKQKPQEHLGPEITPWWQSSARK